MDLFCSDFVPLRQVNNHSMSGKLKKPFLFSFSFFFLLREWSLSHLFSRAKNEICCTHPFLSFFSGKGTGSYRGIKSAASFSFSDLLSQARVKREKSWAGAETMVLPCCTYLPNREREAPMRLPSGSVFYRSRSTQGDMCFLLVDFLLPPPSPYLGQTLGSLSLSRISFDLKAWQSAQWYV